MPEKKQLAYHRILLKLSGESLQGADGFGIEMKGIDQMCDSLADIVAMGVELGMVIGGGNLFRGRSLVETGLNQITADHMGMLATIMNGLCLRDRLLDRGVNTYLMSSLNIDGFVEVFDRRRAIEYMKAGSIVIFVGGTGLPLFTTDTAASLRAIEIDADIILKATKVDGVYSADPQKNPEAQFFKTLTFKEAIDQQLGVMDLTAMCLCQEYGMNIRIFNMNYPGILKRIVSGSDEGTLVSNV